MSVPASSRGRRTIARAHNDYTLADNRDNKYNDFMTGKLATEIRQSRPFRSLHEELFLNLERTAGLLRHSFESLFREHGISKTQYNVLRILRGAGPNGLACSQIAERLVTRDSDVTRLLDRLEKGSLVARHREDSDRRVVTSAITEKGLEVTAALDGPVAQLTKRLLGHLTDRESRSLIDLLEKARSTLVNEA
jgi:DNA-binding MarR family transcriptional regulator